ncbi:ribonuclease H-like domain-containing protein [Tanacetum coccineum]
MSTGDLLATLLNQLGLNNSSAAKVSKNKEVKPSQFPAPITNPNLVAYQAFGPIGPSYFAPPAPMYGPAPTYIQAQTGVPSGQATILPHAFTVRSLHDLTTVTHGIWIQCDHGGEFDNRNLHKLFAENGIQFRFSCPKTSQQNGKSERMVRTINNLIRTLLFQANLPPTFWVEALNMATHLLNILPSTTITNEIPYTRLFGKQPDYSLLRTFGCLCYPHLYPNHKLEPRATPSILLGHASNHRGYRCLDLHTNKIIISRHVTFDETVFPYGSTQPSSVPTYTFLDDSPDIPTQPIRSIPVLDPDTIHATHTPPPNTTPTNTNIAPAARPESPPHATPSHNSPTQQSTTAHDTSPHIQHTHVAQQTPEIDHEQPPTAQNEISPLIISNPPENPNPDSVHPMVTRFRVGTNRPTERLNLYVSSVSPLPKSYRDAFKGVDVDETFSPVVKPGTIRTVLSLAASRHWPTYQLDVKNAFLHGDLSETVYMHQPPGFRDSKYPDHVCLLQRSLYGLKQAPRAWLQRFASYITRVGFHSSGCDSSLFIYKHGPDTAYLLIYVDDIVLTASSQPLLQWIIASLHQEFSMTDLSSLNYFLEILERAHIANCNPCRTPIDTESKLGNDGDPVSDPTLYRSLAGSFQYLTFTRPDISYAVQQVCLHMHDPREPHFSALKRILRYVRGTLDYGLQLFSSYTTSLVAYLDANWAGCPTTRQSTSGYCVFLGNNLLSWSAKRQPTLSRSSAEAEYRGVANVVAETYLVAAGQVRVLHVPSRYQYADIFTKGLPSALFEEFRTSLSVRCPPASTAGEC